MTLSTILIGLGQIGMSYDLHLNSELFILTHARAFQKHSSFELIGGVDPELTRLKTFESVYARPGYTNIATAFRNLHPDIVVISTPTDLHHQSLNAILDLCRPKAVLCEKPLAYNFKLAMEMVDACESRGIKLFVNYMRRADRGVHEIKRRIENGFITQPIKGVCWYSKGILNNGSHFLNLLQDWLGEIKNFDVISQGRLWNNLDPEPDLKVDFALGTIFFLAAREENYSHCSIELLAGNGRLSYEQGGTQIFWQPVVDDPICEGYQTLRPIPEKILSDLNRIQWHVVDQLATNLKEQKTEICSGHEALRTSEIIDQIKKLL